MNLQELTEAASLMIDRSDLDDKIKLFTTLCEADINRRCRVQDMVCVGTSPTNQGDPLVKLPDDYLEMRNIKVDGRPYDFLTPRQFDTLNEHCRYTIRGNKIEISPTPSEVIPVEMSYYKRVPQLGEKYQAVPGSVPVTRTENWLLDKWPDVYLYGVLEKSAYMIYDDPRAQMWKSLYDESVEEIIHQDRAGARWSGDDLVIRYE